MGAEKKQNNEGYNALARTFQARVQRLSRSAPVLEFGVIQEDGALLTNKFPIPIPKTDYHVCRSLGMGEAGSEMTATRDGDGAHGGHTGGDGVHTHAVLLPEGMRSLRPGDHVLVAWVDTDPVVVDIIRTASEVM